MSFRDVYHRESYDHFMAQTKVEQPYRSADGLKRYPLGHRKYSKRYWILRDDGTITIHYDGPLLGVVHPDSTFEFRMDEGRVGYDQGEAMLLTSLVARPGLGGWVMSQAHKGGCVFVLRPNEDGPWKERMIFPVFKGLRVRLSDGKPMTEYEVHTSMLDRKATAPIRKPYEQMFKMAKIMIGTMTPDGVVNELHQMVQGQVSPAYDPKHQDVMCAFSPDDPAGAVLWLTLRYDYREAFSWITMTTRGNVTYYLDRLKREYPHYQANHVNSIKNHFFDELYENAIHDGEQIVTTKVTGPMDKLPTKAWGQKIVVNGAEVQRYL